MIERSWRAALSIQTGLVQASWTGVRLMIGYRALGLGADPFFLGLLASAFALPALLAGLPAGRLSDKTGGSVVALTGMVIAAAGTIGAFSLPGRWTLLAAAGCVGLGQMLIMIGQQTFVANASAHRGSDSAFGTLTAAASIGQLIGPPLVTALASLAIVGGKSNPNTPAAGESTLTDAEITAWEGHSPSQAPGASVEPIEACAVSLPGGHQDHRLAELLQPLCHCAVTARSDLRESGTATMSALNLWNKNTERVSDALSRDRGHLHFSVVSKHVAGQVILRADNLRYGQLAAPNTATTG